MKSINNILQKLLQPRLITLLIAGCFFSISATANAAISYNGYAELDIELVGVTAGNGAGNGNGNGSGSGSGSGSGDGSGPNNFQVSSSASVLDSAINTTGSGVADALTSLLPTTDWDVSSLFFQTSESLGIAGNAAGAANSFADTGFNISVTNNRNSALTFEFLLSAFVSADVFIDGVAGALDDGGAFAEIFLVDELLGDLLYISAEAFIGGLLVDSNSIAQTIEFTLEAGQSTNLSGIIYSDGYAEVVAQVTEPSTMWLALITGICLLTGYSKRRSKQALIQNNHRLF